MSQETALPVQTTPDPASLYARLRPVIAAGLWRHRTLLVAAVLVGAIVGLFRGLVMPNQYQSVGKLYVRPGVREALMPDAILTGVAPGTTTRLSGSREAILNEMQVLSAPELFDNIVDRVGVDAVLAPYDPAGDSYENVPWHTSLFHIFQSWWFASGGNPLAANSGVPPRRLASIVLRRSLSFVPDPGASVIAVSHVSNKPELAQKIVNAALEAAREFHNKVFETMSAIAPLETEARNEEEAARKAEEALREFRVEHQIDDYETTRQGLVSYVRDLSLQIDRIDLEVKGKEGERAEQLVQRSSIPERRIQVGSGSVVLNPAYSQWTEILGGLWAAYFEIERQGIEESSKRPRRELIERQIRDVEGRLKNESVQLTFPGVQEENPNYARVQQRIADIDVDLKRLAAERAQLVQTRTATRARLNELEKLAPRLRELEEDWRQKRTSADRHAESAASLRTAQRLDQLKLSAVQIMHYGTYESDKIAPRRGSMVVYGAAGGGLVGLLIVVMLTLLDPRVRVRGDLVRLDVPAEGILMAGASAKASGVGVPLPPTLADARDDIVRAWASLPYDRRAADPLQIAFLACDAAADSGRAAAALAIGLALHGAERVVYVACSERPSWLANRLGLPTRRGWAEVLRQEWTLEQAIAATPITGLFHLPAGSVGSALPHPMASRQFLALLDQLSKSHRFVVIELPDLAMRPEGRQVLGVVDAVQLVVRIEDGRKADVQAAIDAVRLAGARLLGATLYPRDAASGAGEPAGSPSA
jgi:uncharacterized protein involved in exopolysaccharide biosynthesis